VFGVLARIITHPAALFSLRGRWRSRMRVRRCITDAAALPPRINAAAALSRWH
jgi:hypothetical protein